MTGKDHLMLSISRHERDVLRRELDIAMNGIADLAMTADQGTPDQFMFQIRRHYADTLHLLDDLGWSYSDPRQAFYVTLPPPALRRWLSEIVVALEEDALPAAAECLALAGHYPPCFQFTSEEAAGNAREARVDADEALDLRAVCSSMLARLGRMGLDT